MNLTATTHLLRLTTANVNAVRWEASWTDVDKSGASTTILPGSAQGSVTLATTTTIVAAPSASVYRAVTSIAIYASGGAQTVTVLKEVSATSYTAVKATLALDESLHYEDGAGWYVLDANGARKGVGATGAPGVDGGGTVLASGTVELDFGSGASMATVTVTGQADLQATSLVYCWIHPKATTDHSAEEHMVESIKVHAIDIVAGDRFTIYGFCPDPAVAPQRPQESGLTRSTGTGTYQGPGQAARNAPNPLNQVNLLRGKWTVAWFYTQ